MKKESLNSENDRFLKLFPRCQPLQKLIKTISLRIQEMMYHKISIKMLSEDKLTTKRNSLKFRINFKRFETDHFQNNQRRFGTQEFTLSTKFVKRWMKQS